MADLSDLQAAQAVKVIGSDSTGAEQVPVQSTSNGGIHANLRNNAGTETGTSTTPLRIDPTGTTTQPISAASLPLPSGAATAALQTQPGVDIGDVTINNASGASAVNIQDGGNSITVDGTVELGATSLAALESITVQNGSGASAVNIQDGGNSITIDATSLPLPTGAATSTLQTTGNSSLASIDGKLPLTIGQKTIATSLSVVLASDQTLTTTTSPLPATGSGFCFGSIATNSTAQLPVEATTYTAPSTNSQRSIASASVLDTSAGTGARSVTITYLDQTGAGPFTETLTLNGTTGVNTVATNICFIEKIVVSSVGSTGSNAGIITLYTAINKGGTVIGTVAATINQTLWAHHYTPTGKTSYISGLSYSNDSTNAGNGAYMVLKAKNPIVTTSPLLQISDTNTFPGSPITNTRSYLSPIQIIGPAYIAVYVTPYAGAAQIQYASFDYIDN